MKKELDFLLESNFAAEEWRLERVARLPAAFIQNTVVTPFFQPRVLRKSATHYLIDGYLGFIHREFEQWWLKRSLNSPRVNSHCLALNIANLDELRAKQRIENNAESNLQEFSIAVMEVLKSLPSSAESVREAFNRDLLIGLPFEKFIIHGRNEKL